MNDKTSRDMQKTILERVIEKTQTRTLRGFTSREEIINEDGNKIYKQTIVMYYEGKPSEETPEDSSSVCGDCASYPGCSTVEGGSVDYHGPVCGGFTQSDCAPVNPQGYDDQCTSCTSQDTCEMVRIVNGPCAMHEGAKVACNNCKHKTACPTYITDNSADPCAEFEPIK